MLLNEILPTVSQLSHQDKLRLLHFLIQAVALEEKCDLKLDVDSDLEKALLNQLASTSAVVWSPKADNKAVEALSDLLTAAHRDATVNKLIEENSTIALTEFDAHTRFKALASTGDIQLGLELLARLDHLLGSDQDLPKNNT